MESRRLTRSITDRKIAGVAGGLAHYYGLDPHLVRIAWFIAIFFGGFGLLAYVILWIVLPEGEPTKPALQIVEERYARGEITAEEMARLKADLS
jgi:phage shock protein PspC (stress-responsive transcriptional regulator)